MVTIELIEPMENKPGSASQVLLRNSPNLSGYDFVIFGLPVQAFTLAGVMKKYLSSLPNFKNKNGYSFVTRQLKKKWLGGSRAIKWIENKCQEKGINILDSAMISWSSKTLDNDINDVINKLSDMK